MEIKIGCDIVHLPRFKKILGRTPAMRRRLFSAAEAQNASFGTLAGIFAAKEAVIKALGTAAGKWRDIEIVRQKNGRPRLKLNNSLKHRFSNCDLSISHDGDYASAFVCFYNKDDTD